MAKASVAKSRLLKIQPGLTIARIKSVGISDNKIFLERTERHILAGLRKSGIPEQ